MTNFNFTLDNFQITNTRSKHEDTDYLSFTLQIGGGAPQTLVKSMGNINNGTHTVGLSFLNVQLDTSDPIAFNYIVVNCGTSTRVSVETTLETVGPLLASTVPGPGFPSPPEFGSALQVDQNWLETELKSVFVSGCDGPVAAECSKFTLNDLHAKAGSFVFHQSTKHPGIDSAKGCGSNSAYIVNWHVAPSAVVPAVEGLDAGKGIQMIQAAGLVVNKRGSGPKIASIGPSAGVVLDLGSSVTVTLGKTVS